MNELTQRFLEVYNKLIEKNIISNASDFAKKCGVSSSLITEILKERTNVGVGLLQNAVMAFDIDAHYILTGKPCTNNVEITPKECPYCAEKNYTISLQLDTINILKESQDLYKFKIDTLTEKLNTINKAESIG